MLAFARGCTGCETIPDAATFVKQIAGTGGRFTLEELDSQLRDMVSSRFADALGQSKIPALDLAGNYDQLGQYILANSFG